MQVRTSSAWESIYVMSDTILARVSETLSTEQSLEGLVRQLLEMLEIVTDMESTYLTKVDISARLQHILYARNSKQMQIPEGLSVPWGDTSLLPLSILMISNALTTVMDTKPAIGS